MNNVFRKKVRSKVDICELSGDTQVRSVFPRLRHQELDAKEAQSMKQTGVHKHEERVTFNRRKHSTVVCLMDELRE